MFLSNHAVCLVIASSAVVLTATIASVVYPSFWPEGDPFWLRAELVAEKRDYASGESIPMKLTLFNPGNQPVEVFFPSGCQLVWYVYDVDGNLIRGNFTIVCAAVVGGFSMMPGDTVEYPFTWDQKDNQGNQVPLGVYIVVAFTYSSVRYSASTVFVAGRS